jgi:hypothetical protein
MDQGMSPVFLLCDEYLTQWAVLDPVAAGTRGLSGAFGAVTDYSPDGHAARAELVSRTLAALAGLSGPGLPATGGADRLAALVLRERLEAQAAWHAAGEQGYAELARYLREQYAPRATDVDGVGADRYALGARLSLGADLDAREAYEWAGPSSPASSASSPPRRPGSGRGQPYPRPRSSSTRPSSSRVKTLTRRGCRTGTTRPSSG